MRAVRVVAFAVCFGAAAIAQDTARAPVIVVETPKGTFAFETYPLEAPKTGSTMTVKLPARSYSVLSLAL